MRLLACQIEIPAVCDRTARRHHLRALVARIDAAIDQRGGVDLIALPELCTIDYSRAAFARLAELAEPLDGASGEVFAALAQRHAAHVCYGLPRAAADGYRIAQVLRGPDGALLGHYDKLHTAHFGASMEADYFRRGEQLFAFEVAGLRCAPLICYDFRFPALARRLCREAGAELLLHAVAFCRDGSFASWHPFAVTRALENQVYLLSLNRAGAQWGESLFCPPWAEGEPPGERFGHGEELRFFELDRDAIRRARQRYPLRDDELPDYAALPLISPR